MKHFIVHLIYVILLIVLLLVLLDEIGSKLAGDKQLQETSEQLRDASAQIERLRTEKSRTEEDLAGTRATVADLEGKLALLEESVAEMERRFQIVSARDVKMLGLSFEQHPRSEADAAISMNLADSLKAPTPAEFKAAAEKM